MTKGGGLRAFIAPPARRRFFSLSAALASPRER